VARLSFPGKSGRSKEDDAGRDRLSTVAVCGVVMLGNQWGAGGGKVIRVECDPSEDGSAATK
jgi:hypothetical protein